jgi:DNA adenine methylase
MHYLGGKMKMRKHLVPLLQRNMRSVYVEPFVGSAWIFAEINAPRMEAYDTHPDLILLWQALREGWVPPTTVTEADYEALRTAEPSAMRGFVGFACSFGGKWFGGYARHVKGITDTEAFAGSATRGLQRKLAAMQGKNITFTRKDYRELTTTADTLVYADPPYAATTAYKSTTAFDHAVFWEWCRVQPALVLVSEYTAPADFVCIGEFPYRTALRTTDAPESARVERVFVHEQRQKEVT